MVNKYCEVLKMRIKESHLFLDEKFESKVNIETICANCLFYNIERHEVELDITSDGKIINNSGIVQLKEIDMCRYKAVNVVTGEEFETFNLCIDKNNGHCRDYINKSEFEEVAKYIPDRPEVSE